MELNDSTDTECSGFSASDLLTDFNDRNNGIMYNTKETCLGECLKVTFFEKSIYDEMMEMLLKLYNFEQNMPQTGLIATTELARHRLVITAYNSRKL